MQCSPFKVRSQESKNVSTITFRCTRKVSVLYVTVPIIQNN